MNGLTYWLIKLTFFKKSNSILDMITSRFKYINLFPLQYRIYLLLFYQYFINISIYISDKQDHYYLKDCHIIIFHGLKLPILVFISKFTCINMPSLCLMKNAYSIQENLINHFVTKFIYICLSTSTFISIPTFFLTIPQNLWVHVAKGSENLQYFF